MSDAESTIEPVAVPADALVAFIGECATYFDFSEGAIVPIPNVRGFKLLFGCCLQVIRLARGATLLREHGLSIESQLLVRSALEYATAAQYAYLRKDGLDRLYKSAVVSQASLAERFQKFTGDAEFGRIAAETDIPEAGKELPDTAGILLALDPHSVFPSQAYTVLSQSTHVTYSVLMRFLAVDDAGQVHLNEDPADTMGDSTMFTLAASCMLATWVMARLRADDRMRARLDNISDELMLPVRLDGEWKRKDRAHLDDGA